MTKLYDSNTDEYTFPKKSGWYIQWKNESSDTGFFKVEVDEIKNENEALEILKKERDYEIEDGHFYAYVDFFCYIDVKKEKKEKKKNEKGQNFNSLFDGDGNEYSIPDNLVDFFEEDSDPGYLFDQWVEYYVKK